MLQHSETTVPPPGLPACAVKTRIGPSAVFGQTRTEPLPFVSHEAHRTSTVSRPEVASDLGLYTQPDPIGLRGGTNLYLYTKANPVGFVDPFGLCCTAMDRFRDLLLALHIVDTNRDRTLFAQFCNGKIFDWGSSGCGYNADGLAETLGRELKCYSARRVDAGPQTLFPGVFQYSRIIPHSFVSLTSKDQCEPCLVLPEVFVDNYSGTTTLGYLP